MAHDARGCGFCSTIGILNSTVQPGCVPGRKMTALRYKNISASGNRVTFVTGQEKMQGARQRGRC
jgi:hypothetical protein